MLREAATVNGITGLAMNKLDVLAGLAEVPICTAYRIDGRLVHEFPMTLGELSRAEPVYEAMPGWSGALCDVRQFDALPDAARRYVDRVEALVGVPVDLVSIGPGRDETIVRRDPFAA
jgi:adenylosuccinate synthase